ncbi:MAG: cytochrome c biogenesis protein DipZ [Candidatus Moranbacteria bacterium]|nr:cytochrome c biogenesis protein DipZ [Candidatus Moranbacteria bacterium]
MLALLFFTFLSGIVTIFAPCIWPILPIILSSSVSGGKRKPLGLVTGLAVSFIFFTLTLATIVTFIPFDPEVLRYFAVAVIAFLGLVLAVPQFGDRLEVLVSRLGSFGGRFTSGRGDGFGGGLITGAALGLIWTPCAGPILAAVATLAATRAVSLEAFLLIVVYVAGVSIPLYILTLVGGKALAKTRGLSLYTGTIQKVFGIIMILSALMIFFGYDKKLQTSLLEQFPDYGKFLNVFESQAEKTGQLETIRTGKEVAPGERESLVLDAMLQTKLENLGVAPEITGINGWLNSDGTSLKALRGKVVLIDFWTYSCINCIRTLPYVTSWYEKYKDQGFVVIGVHTPEFAFEHKKENVAEALKKYNIQYPVAQDNDYATWQAYNNRYWPAHYLIDAEGNVRRVHFGEGEYEETEAAIVTLLKEAGKKVTIKKEYTQDETPTRSGIRTPETYLGSDRGERLVSQEKITGSRQIFTAPLNIKAHEYAFEGEWQVEDERAMALSQGKLQLRFQGEKVFLVMSPGSTGSSKVQVYLNDKMLSVDVSGKDVSGGVIEVNEDRLYEIIDFKGQSKEGLLRLEFLNETAVYAFTFA